MNDLSAILSRVREAVYELPAGIDPASLLPDMLAEVGNPDPTLRDELIYTTFVYWIELKPQFDPPALRHILTTAVSNLQVGLGEIASDTLFVRSFSMLLIPLVLIRHREQAFLTPAEIHRLKADVLSYLAAEQDLRGYIPGQGWGHAVAHAADALSELAACAELDEQALLDLLTAIQQKVAMPVVYTHSEEERLVDAVMSIYERQLVERWRFWLLAFDHLYNKVDVPEGYYRFVNIKNFLQSLYYRSHPYPEFHAAVGEAVHRILR